MGKIGKVAEFVFVVTVAWLYTATLGWVMAGGEFRTSLIVSAGFVLALMGAVIIAKVL